MKQLLIRFWVGISLGFIISTGACAQMDADDRECVFDEAGISEVRYSSSSAVAEYLWDDSNKVAKGILVSGSLFQTKYWACDHYGARAISLVGPLTDIDPQALTAEFILLANLSLDTAEADLVRDHLTQSRFVVAGGNALPGLTPEWRKDVQTEQIKLLK